MNISHDIKTSVSIDPIKLHKMAFLYNALEEGQKINKKKDMYIFTKNHEGKKEVFLDNYLKTFLENNFDINKIINQTNQDDTQFIFKNYFFCIKA